MITRTDLLGYKVILTTCSTQKREKRLYSHLRNDGSGNQLFPLQHIPGYHRALITPPRIGETALPALLCIKPHGSITDLGPVGIGSTQCLPILLKQVQSLPHPLDTILTLETSLASANWRDCKDLSVTYHIPHFTNHNPQD